MTMLNPSIFDGLRANGANPIFLQAFQTWIDKLPVFEAFRQMSQGSGVQAIVRFANDTDTIPSNAAAQYVPATYDNNGQMTKPPELLVRLANF